MIETIRVNDALIKTINFSEIYNIREFVNLSS